MGETIGEEHIGRYKLLTFLIKKNYFIYLFLTALGFRCCTQAFLVAASRGYSLLRCAGLSLSGFSCCGAQALGVWASVVVALGLSSAGSVVVAHRLSCSAACGIFSDQGSNPCSLHWQADS